MTKVTFTDPALAELDEILAYTEKHHPASLDPLRKRIETISRQIGEFPKSGRVLDNAAGVRMISLTRFPFSIFYRIGEKGVEVLHVRHSARKSLF